MWIDLKINTGLSSVNSIRFLPHSDQSSTEGLIKNGIITKYRVDISKDNGQTYEALIHEGEYEVTNVRLYCLESADKNNSNPQGMQQPGQ